MLRSFLESMRSLQLFDHSFYREKYYPSAQSNKECLEHYLDQGAKCFHKPHWLIDPLFLVNSGRIKKLENLLGELRKRIQDIDTCHPIFDPTFYRAKYGQSLCASSSPFLHYLKLGAYKNLSPSPWFDPAYYFSDNRDLRSDTVVAVKHFLTNSTSDWLNARVVRSPTWWFNAGYYLQCWELSPYSDPLSHLICENPERLGINYVFDRLLESRSLCNKTGDELENLAESLAEDFPQELTGFFSPQHYLQIHPDLRKSTLNPVKHFVAHGVLEQRAHFTHPLLAGVCIVTPDALGPVKNGGIGTACFHYAISSAKAGNKTFVLYTGPMKNTEFADIKKLYSQVGIQFDYIGRLESMPKRTWASIRELDIAAAVNRFLRRHEFDTVLFQDWKAHGFWSIREKRLGRAFQNTHLSVICHSPSQWQDEGMHIFPANSLDAAKLRWAERESIRNADSVICPSRHMENWLRSNDYLGDSPVYHAPYTYNYRSASRYGPARPFVFAFFGRLEKRKGLDVFLDAVSLLSSRDRNQIKKLLFLGKIAMVDGDSANLPIENFTENTGIAVEIHTTLDTNEAISLLKREQAIAVVPSIVDNLPLVVIECIAHNIPLLASSVGGIPEMLPEQALFEPTPESLAATIAQAISDGIPNHEPLWTADSAESCWTNLLSNLRLDPGREQPNAEPVNPPEVTVCVPNYNHARYLPSLMLTLARQTHLPKRVIIVDDGSTAPETEGTFRELKKKNWPFDLQIIRSENSGPGHARNLAAKAADTPLLCFIDADNVPVASMIESMRNALLYGCLDAVFGAYDIYDTDVLDLNSDKSEERYSPLGNYTGSAWIQNDMGDSFVMIKRETFLSLGGFDDAPSAHEDWLFSLRLNISGARVSSLCEPLLQYRRTDNSRCRQMNEFSHCKSVEALARSAPQELTTKWIEHMIWQGYIVRSHEH